MEKKMEKMRNEIVGQNKFYGAIAALGIAMVGMMSSGMVDNAYSLNEHSGDFMHGFVLGIVLVMEFYAVSGIGKNLKALKDEKKLARLYNELHDERSEQIEAISSKTGMQIAMILTLAALQENAVRCIIFAITLEKKNRNHMISGKDYPKYPNFIQ